MSDALDKLEAGLYELCPTCEGYCTECVNCDGTGMVLHDCEPEPDE